MLQPRAHTSFEPFRSCQYWKLGLADGYFDFDMDFWDRVWDLEAKHEIASIVALNASVYHTSGTWKKLLYLLTRNTYCASNNDDALSPWRRTEWHGTPTLSRMVAGRRERLLKLFWPHGDVPLGSAVARRGRSSWSLACGSAAAPSRLSTVARCIACAEAMDAARAAKERHERRDRREPAYYTAAARHRLPRQAHMHLCGGW